MCDRKRDDKINRGCQRHLLPALLGIQVNEMVHDADQGSSFAAVNHLWLHDDREPTKVNQGCHLCTEKHNQLGETARETFRTSVTAN